MTIIGFRYDLTGQRVNLKPDDLVVDRHDRAPNQVEAVGVVGHGDTEMIVSLELGARIPCALDSKVAHIKGLTTFVRKGFSKPRITFTGPNPSGKNDLGLGATRKG